MENKVITLFFREASMKVVVDLQANQCKPAKFCLLDEGAIQAVKLHLHQATTLLLKLLVVSAAVAAPTPAVDLAQGPPGQLQLQLQQQHPLGRLWRRQA